MIANTRVGRRFFATMLVAVVVAGTLSAGGCQRSGRGDAGRGGAGAQGVPASAQRVAGGTSSLLQYNTRRAGTVYVYDATDRRVVWSGPVRDAANVSVDPAGDAITVNDKQVPSSGPDAPPLNDAHWFEIYFNPLQR